MSRYWNLHDDETHSSPILDALIDKGGNTHHMVTRSKAGVFKPKAYLTLSNNLPNEPSDVYEAKIHKIWYEAMLQELRALDQNRTWKLVPKDPS